MFILIITESFMPKTTTEREIFFLEAVFDYILI